MVQPTIRAVTLDCWETLIRDSPDHGGPRSDDRIRRMAGVLGCDESALRQAYQETYSHIEAIQATDIEVGVDDQLRIILAPLMLSQADRVDWPSLRAAYIDPLFDSPPIPAPNVLPALDALRDRGYRLALICNTGRSPAEAMRRLLDRYGILERLDVTVFSDEETIRKPDPRIFHRTVERLGVAGAVHVGDNPRDDIAGAHAAGLRAILIGDRRGDDPPDATIGDLIELADAVDALNGRATHS